MTELVLTTRERQEKRGQAHALDPVVLLGAQGLTPAVMREIDRALSTHELIKIRVPGDERDAREAMFRQIAEELNAARIQSIGKLLVLFRPLPDDVQAARNEKALAAAKLAARAAARSPKAPSTAPRTKKAAFSGAAPAAPSRPGRRDIRQATARTTAPRRTGGRAR